jgi:benzoate membrane transport protein
VAFFTGLPKALVSTIAGLALTGAIANSLTGAMAEPREREAALIAFLLTASDISLFGVGAAFWGLVAGGLAYAVMTAGARAKKA